jgi:hypothetical protein
MIRSLLAAVMAATPFVVLPHLPPRVARALSSPPAADYDFHHDLRRGQTLAVTNIDGNVTVRRGEGRTAHVTVTKVVRRGNGDLVEALLEETAEGIRVCTVYRSVDDPRPTRCHGNRGTGSHSDPLDVTMTYTVVVPSGVQLDVSTVDGNVEGGEIDTSAHLTTVDGDVTWHGVLPEQVTTVDGNIAIDVVGAIDHDARFSTVDGDIRVTVPGAAQFVVTATSVDGDIDSDFPLTVQGKWGPRALRGTVNGGGPTLRFTTVDGSLALRRH